MNDPRASQTFIQEERSPHSSKLFKGERKNYRKSFESKRIDSLRERPSKILVPKNELSIGRLFILIISVKDNLPNKSANG